MPIPPTIAELAERSALGLLRRSGGDCGTILLRDHMRARFDPDHVYQEVDWFRLAVKVYAGYWNAKKAGYGDGKMILPKKEKTGESD